jgi:hypothetical protein
MKLKILLTIMTTMLLLGCKKDYTCISPDPLIDQSGFIIHDTKSKATKKCQDTKNPFNESKCGLIK